MLHRVFLFAVILTGCAQETPREPIKFANTQDECGYIRSEIARKKYLGEHAQGNMAPVFQQMAIRDVANLETRSANIGCAGAFSGPVATPNIESCITACKANTGRTPEQCFDSCNK